MGAPFYRETILPNGVRVVTKNFPGAKTFCLAIVIRRGSQHDPPRLAGLSHFLEHLVHRGTKRWPTDDRVNFQYESRGLTESAETSYDYTSFYIHEAMPQFLRRCFDFLAEIVTSPLFPDEAIAKEKGVVIVEHFTDKDRSEIEVTELLRRMLYVHSSLGRRIEGYPKTIKRIQRADLVRMHQRYYVPNNIIVVAVGQANHKQVVKLSRNYLGHLQYKKTPSGSVRDSRISTQQCRRVCRSALNNAYINIGTKFTSLTRKELAILEILGNVLGGSTLSRFYRLIRNELGKAYTIKADVSTLNNTHELVIETAPRIKDLEQIINLIKKELERIKKEGITHQELRLAKIITIAEYYRLIKYSTDFFDELIASLVQGTTKTDFFKSIPFVRSITQRDVKEFLTRYWKPENFRIAIIAPKK